jgi:glycosyltransferase 2 family protein
MKFLLKLVITCVLVVLIIWYLGGLEETIAVISQADLRYLLAGVLVLTLDRILMTYKWSLLLQSRGLQLPLMRGTKIYCASMIWGMFLPSTVGSDAIRAFMTCRGGLDSSNVITSIVVERMIGFISALLLGLIGLFILDQTGQLDPRFQPVWWMGGVMLGGAILIFGISLSHSLFDFIYEQIPKRLLQNRIAIRLQKLHKTYVAYNANKKILTKFFGLTFGQQLLAVIITWLIARGLGIDVGILFMAGVLPLTLLISRLPVSINGLGVFEGVFILLMSLGGVSAAEAVSIAVTGRLLEIVSFLPWWLAYVIDDGTIRPPTPLQDHHPSG